MPASGRSTEPLALRFRDDGTIPNNPHLPFLVYRGAIVLEGQASPEHVIESTESVGVSFTHGFLPMLRASADDLPLDALITEDGVMWQRP